MVRIHSRNISLRPNKLGGFDGHRADTGADFKKLQSWFAFSHLLYCREEEDSTVWRRARLHELEDILGENVPIVTVFFFGHLSCKWLKRRTIGDLVDESNRWTLK